MKLIVGQVERVTREGVCGCMQRMTKMEGPCRVSQQEESKTPKASQIMYRDM